MNVNAEGTTVADVRPMRPTRKSTLRSLWNRVLAARSGMVVCRGCGTPTKAKEAIPCEHSDLWDGGGYECLDCIFKDFPVERLEPIPQNAHRGSFLPRGEVLGGQARKDTLE